MARSKILRQLFLLLWFSACYPACISSLFSKQRTADNGQLTALPLGKVDLD